MPYIAQFENLKELNLEDNNITRMPDDLSEMFRNITIINLNGNEFEDYEHAIRSLTTIPNLKSLFINLHMEEQVDMVMRMLEDLEELNGLPVERDLIEGEGEDEESDQGAQDQNDDEQDKRNNRYGDPTMEFSAEQKRIDILCDGLEEIKELRRESESKNNSVVGLLKDEAEHAEEEQSSPIRESHDKNPLLEDDYGQQLMEDNDLKIKLQN